MINPVVTVKHVDPNYKYYVKIDPAKFWQAVYKKMTGFNFFAADVDRMNDMVRLATGPSFTLDEIRDGIATDMSGKPVDSNLNPAGFSGCVVEEMLKKDYASAARDHFFSRKVLQEAGIITKT